MIRTAVFDLELASRQSRSDDEGSGFNSIGNDRVLGATERCDALDLYRLRPRAVDSRSHLVQQVGEIDYLGLACSVVKRRGATRECCRHHQVFSSSDGDFAEMNIGSVQTPVLRRARNDVSGFEFYFRAKLLKSCQMQIDW